MNISPKIKTIIIHLLLTNTLFQVFDLDKTKQMKNLTNKQTNKELMNE